ncbi:AvrPphF family type III effector [Brenneria rubrifaciens]|nr:AvrPphF family type III effector [Brenneria rubrifaciens]
MQLELRPEKLIKHSLAREYIMGNFCITRSAGPGSPGSPGAAEHASSSTNVHTRGGQTINSVYDLPYEEREEFLNAYDPVRSMGLNENTLLYRSTERRFISNNQLKGNPNSIASISNHERVRPNPYLGLIRGATPHFPVEMRASDLGTPSLNVMVGPQARGTVSLYASGRQNVTVEMSLGDFMREGGRVYNDSSSAMSSEYATALIVTLPRGSSVPVRIV